MPGDERVALLPEDPDASARRLRAEIRSVSGNVPAVVIADSFGRPWRLGRPTSRSAAPGSCRSTTGAGAATTKGRELEATAVAIADEAAAAADLVRDKASAVPAAVITGLARHITATDGPGAAALRARRRTTCFARRSQPSARRSL